MTAGERRNLFRHGELALVLLALLRGRRMHGYELLTELERLVPGYRPSPGSVYPALRALVDEGLVRAVEDSRDARRRSFDITASGEAALEQRAATLTAFEMRSGARIAGVDAVASALDHFRARVLKAADRLDSATVVAQLDDAAQRLETAARLGDRARHG